MNPDLTRAELSPLTHEEYQVALANGTDPDASVAVVFRPTAAQVGGISEQGHLLLNVQLVSSGPLVKPSRLVGLNGSPSAGAALDVGLSPVRVVMRRDQLTAVTDDDTESLPKAVADT